MRFNKQCWKPTTYSTHARPQQVVLDSSHRTDTGARSCGFARVGPARSGSLQVTIMGSACKPDHVSEKQSSLRRRGGATNAAQNSSRHVGNLARVFLCKFCGDLRRFGSRHEISFAEICGALRNAVNIQKIPRNPQNKQNAINFFGA